MCEYCETNNNFEATTEDKEDIIDVKIENAELVLEPILSGVWYDCGSTSLRIKIEYCPFCGKHLTTNNNGITF